LKQLAKYLLGLGAILWSCSDNEPPNRQKDQEYFPLRVGYFQIYSVEETNYINIDQSTTSLYELKTEVVDSFTNDGLVTYVIHRSKRADEAASWEFIETWSARVNEWEVVINEGTTSFIKISFPAFENKQWNGNALNSMPEDLYLYDSKGVSVDLENGQTFSDCLVIIQEDYLDVLSKEDRQEVYARNQGLIYKKYIVLNYCDVGDCFGQQQIVNGIEYIQVLKEYGDN
jgi:hypothetical protein